jgi:hypothetical protein
MMRLFRSALLVVACAAAFATAAVAAGQRTPAETLRTEVGDLQAGRYRAFYALMSPRFRARCTFAKLEAMLRQQRAALRAASVRVLRSRVVGANAYLDYSLVRQRKVLLTIRGDVYVRIRGAWYDEYDRFTSC